MKTVAIIAASGVGKRMKLDGGMSKQMIEIGGHTVIWHTMKAFQDAESVDAVYIATKSDSIEPFKQLARENGFTKIHSIIEGGKERQDSIRNCMDLIEEEIESSGVMPDAILVHDGARPFIQPEEIDEIARISAEHGACVPATKPKDTIKYIGRTPEVFGETLDRSRLLQVQTPQGFTPAKLIEAHRKAASDGVYATDDAALVERYFPEQEIHVYEMGYHNIKITTPEDVPVGEAILAGLKARKSEN
ncbi:4-diphosphocytidyl-2C-methyl-D-erythritol synthase [Chlorobaculum parvum NCIB 8327]|uniref:2-C-methyl-D-erythritol 4-phosphate cytidylyltransferase n=1 Tax=Chlorobaculum parvum (strain DSM 263 / NCIMB 8327) TaxID=517417 RepID=ISPD_CHLP8|nr:IspD/TarI family cytidylyltransferase [Chlorobaculum parvum]B3QP85.1 RecName: Full=2-C-methyl-D-erythritol 4-phosphate cytidylyltransferase; AltName: Full=4-diphosphocytidyl-2C-methyl-D-erythritol synthase; AltName: Full=MEP cytidylyltransferase; Short=MCT [Chlorobaculum parvum NCIB 8327]ACF11738.1 4-diphosphocytidyl-2C-methyl-D-erythritol synthase [Chlorobaculum parvum NCIB 8327]